MKILIACEESQQTHLFKARPTLVHSGDREISTIDNQPVSTPYKLTC